MKRLPILLAAAALTCAFLPAPDPITDLAATDPRPDPDHAVLTWTSPVKPPAGTIVTYDLRRSVLPPGDFSTDAAWFLAAEKILPGPDYDYNGGSAGLPATFTAPVTMYDANCWFGIRYTLAPGGGVSGVSNIVKSEPLQGGGSPSPSPSPSPSTTGEPELTGGDSSRCGGSATGAGWGFLGAVLVAAALRLRMR